MVNFNPNADNTFNLSFLWARFCPAGFCFMSASPLRILVSCVVRFDLSRLYHYISRL